MKEKIQTEIRYIARDGNVCFSKEQCVLYESMLDIHDKYYVPDHHQEVPNIQFRGIQGIDFFRVCSVEEFRELFTYFASRVDSAFASSKWRNMTDWEIEKEWVNCWFFPYIYYYPDSCHEVELLHIEYIMESKEEEINCIQNELQELYKIKYNPLYYPNNFEKVKKNA